MSHQLLFLCTGNYFRSRFAEILFNYHAPRHGLLWIADSRGVAIELGSRNLGPLSHYTLRGLAQRGIHLPAPKGPRFPIQLAERDLCSARRIIALKEAEHRPLIARHFPFWLDRIEYWHVHDIDCADPDESLAHIEAEVTRLIERLKGGTS